MTSNKDRWRRAFEAAHHSARLEGFERAHRADELEKAIAAGDISVDDAVTELIAEARERAASRG